MTQKHPTTPRKFHTQWVGAAGGELTRRTCGGPRWATEQNRNRTSREAHLNPFSVALRGPPGVLRVKNLTKTRRHMLPRIAQNDFAADSSDHPAAATSTTCAQARRSLASPRSDRQRFYGNCDRDHNSASPDRGAEGNRHRAGRACWRAGGGRTHVCRTGCAGHAGNRPSDSGARRQTAASGGGTAGC
jgi:hypothetical protein